MLDRYRKKNGFSQLLNLIEGSHIQKREQFLNLIREESPIWESELRKRILTFERLTKWNPQYLSEIFTRVQPLTLAVAYYEYPVDVMNQALSQLSPTLIKKIEITQSEVKPTQADRFTCQIKIIEEARALFARGTLQLVKVDEELFIPNQIEEIISEKEREAVVQKRIEAVSQTIEEKVSEASASSLKPHVSLVPPVDAKEEAKIAVQSNPKPIDTQKEEPHLELDPKKLSSEVFLKQINEEMMNLKKRVEKLSNENHHLLDESNHLRSSEAKLKEDVSILRKEVQSLKHENMLMKSKLDQIKKIA